MSHGRESELFILASLDGLYGPLGKDVLTLFSYFNTFLPFDRITELTEA